MFIAAQVLGFVAYYFLFLSYLKNEKKDFLKTQIFANLFFIGQYATLNAWSAFVSSSLSIARTICYYNYDKNNKKPNVKILILFEMLIITFGVITYNGLYSIIPIIICCIYAFSTWQENLKTTYILAIFASIMWICYNAYIGAYISVFGSIMELIASVIGLVKIIKITKESRALIV
jgi:hypothetical protein